MAPMLPQTFQIISKDVKVGERPIAVALPHARGGKANLGGRVVETYRDFNAKEVLVVARGGSESQRGGGRPVDYVGVASEELEEHDDELLERQEYARRKRGCRFALGVLKGGQMHITPLRTHGGIVRLEPRVRGIEYLPPLGLKRERDNREQKTDTLLLDGREQAEMLVNQFGAKRAKAELQRNKRRKVGNDELSQATAEMLENVAVQAPHQESATKAALQALTRGLPPLNLDARVAKDAYPLRRLVPEQLTMTLSGPAKELLSAVPDKDGLEAGPMPKLSFVVQAIAKSVLGRAGDRELTAKALVFASYMIKFYTTPNSKLRSKQKSPMADIAAKVNLPPFAMSYLAKRFATQETKQTLLPDALMAEEDVAAEMPTNNSDAPYETCLMRSKALLDELGLHIIVVLLATQDYVIDLLDLSLALKKPVSELVKLSKILGCQPVRKSSMRGGGGTNRVSSQVSLMNSATGLTTDPTLSDLLPDIKRRVRAKKAN